MDTQPERVAFTEGQVLRTRDLQDEQAYHLQASREHNVSAHSWGIARGLKLEVRDGLAIVTAGLAIDRRGCVLELTTDTPVRETVLNDNSIRKEAPWGVWLRYAEVEQCRESQLHSHCARKPKDPTCDDPTCDRLRTSQVPALTPTRVSKDPPGEQPIDDSRVFLGRLVFDAGTEKWAVNPDGRRYVGLIAERVVAPERPGEGLQCPDDPIDGKRRGAWVQIGTDAKYPDDLFAVRFPRPPAEEGVPTPDAWLAVSKAGRVALVGPEVAVAGRVMMENGAAIGFERLSADEAAKNRQPPFALDSNFWTIYRHYHGTGAKDSKGNLLPDSLEALDTGQPIPGDELRIAFPREPGDGVTPRLVVGGWADGKFASVLEVQRTKTSRTVTVNGNLILTGTYIGPAPVVGGGTIAAPATSTDPAAHTGFPEAVQYWTAGPNDTAAANGQKYLATAMWGAKNGPAALGKAAVADKLGEFLGALAGASVQVQADSLLRAPDGPDAIGKSKEGHFVRIAGMIDGLFTRADADGPGLLAEVVTDAKSGRLSKFVDALESGTRLRTLVTEVFADSTRAAVVAEELPGAGTASLVAFARGLGAGGASHLAALAGELTANRDQAITILEQLPGSTATPPSYFNELTGAVIRHVEVPADKTATDLFAATDKAHADDPARLTRIIEDWRSALEANRNVLWVGMSDFGYAMADGKDIPNSTDPLPAPETTLAFQLLGFLREHKNPHVQKRYALIKACVDKLENP